MSKIHEYLDSINVDEFVRFIESEWMMYASSNGMTLKYKATCPRIYKVEGHGYVLETKDAGIAINSFKKKVIASRKKNSNVKR